MLNRGYADTSIIGAKDLETLPGLPGDGGYLLHAHSLTLHHPIAGEQIHVEAPLPPGF